MTSASRRVPEIVTQWENHSSGIRTNLRRVQATSPNAETVASQKIAGPPSIVRERRFSYTRLPGLPLPLSPSQGSQIPHHWRPESNTQPIDKASPSLQSPTVSASTAISHEETDAQTSTPRIESLNTQLDEIKAETNHLKQQRHSTHQTMSTLKSQLKNAQDQADKATANNSDMRREISRLHSLLQDARDEEVRLNDEIDRRIQRQMEVMDQMEAALRARLRSLQLSDEGIPTKGKGMEGEFIVARSVKPGTQRGKHRSKRKSR